MLAFQLVNAIISMGISPLSTALIMAFALISSTSSAERTASPVAEDNAKI